MRYNKGLTIVTFLVVCFVGLSILLKHFKVGSYRSQMNGIRVGWQIPWATEGQLVQAMKHKNLLQKQNLNPNFIGFSSGAPLNEAALSGKVDVILTADQPAATLLNKNSDWVIIGRLMYNRVSLYVPPDSPIKSGADLRGKTVAMPFGAAAQRLAYKVEQNAGLDPSKDVKNINIDIYEQSSLITDKNATKWGNIDAVAGFDPTPAVLEEKGLIRNIAVGKVVSVVMMSKSYIIKNPNAPTEFLRALNNSYVYYKANVGQVDQWFRDESKLNVSSKALEISASIEPNMTQPNINLSLNDDDYQVLQQAADFIYSVKLINKDVTMKDFVNLSSLKNVNN